MPSAIRLRDATAADLPALLALEAIFPGDRMNRRQLRRHLDSPRARLRVAAASPVLRGASLVFFRAGSTVARLYSLVVAPGARGNGLGARLLADTERGARARGCDRLRLEVRVDNARAIALYRRAGYVLRGRAAGYYEDGAEALRLEKRL